MNIFDPHITGSLSVSASAHIEGDLTVLGTIRGVAELTGEVGSAISASHAASYLLTSSFEGVSGSFAITGSNNFKGDQTISGSLLPEGTLVHNIGSDSQRWNDLYLAGNTIDIGGTKISKTDGGDVELKDSSNVLKKLIASEIQIGSGPNAKTLKVSNGRFKLTTGLEELEEGLAQLSGAFTGSFSGDGSQLTNVPASGVTGLSLDSISSGSNSLAMGVTTLVSNVSILPNITDTIDLGSPDKQWRDLFLSSGSLYINGQQVLSSTGNELRITTDTGESIKIIETSTDTITLQTEDGDITLTSSGNGNIELDAPIQIGAGNKILSSDGNEIQFGNGLSITGSIVLSGTVDGVDVAGLKTNVDAILSGSNANYDTFAEIVTLINSVDTSNDESFASHYTASNSRFNSIEITTSSFDGRIDSLETFTGSVDGTIRSDLNTYTSSNDGRLVSIESQTGSYLINSDLSTLEGQVSSLETETGSINTKLSSIETTTGSLKGRITSLETESGSVDGRLDSLETETGSINTKLSSINITTGSLKARITSLETTTSSLDGRLDSVEITTGSLKGRIGSLESFTASIDDTYASDSDVTTLRTDLNTYTSSNNNKIGSLETTTGSLKGRVDSIESFTASINNTYATDQDVTTLRTDLNTYTSSNDTTNTNQGLRLDTLEMESGSIRGTLNTFTSSINSIIKSKLNVETVVSGSRQIDVTGTTNYNLITDRLDSVETFTGSIDDQVRLDLNTYTSSNNANITTLNTFKTSVDGGLQFTGSNVTIKGNLLVKGTETRVNSTTIDLNDNIISLNGTGASDAGIEVRDVTSPGILSGSLLWDGLNNFWKGGTKGNEERLLKNSDLTILDGRLDSIEITTGSLDGRLDSIEITTGSLDGRLDSVESKTGSYLTSYINTVLTGGTFNTVNGIITLTKSDGNTVSVDIDGKYSDSGHTHTFSSLTSKPTTLSGYGITDAATSAQGTKADTAFGWGDHSIEGYIKSFTNTNEFVSGVTFNTADGVLTFTRNNGGDRFTVDIDGRYSLLNHVHTFASLTSKPTTLSGYGITDAATSAQGTKADTAFGWGNHASAGYISSFTDTNEFVTGATFNSGNGVITFTRNNGGDTFTVDIDGRFLDTRAQVHSELFSTGGDANDYREFGIYRNYASNGPIGSHNTILHVSQTDGNYGFQLGGSTVVNGDGLYFRNFAGTNTITGSTWYHIATRDWVGDQNYVTTTGYNNGNWDTAFGWGNHASVGYLTSYNNEFVTGATFSSINGVVTFTRNDGDTFTVDLDGRYLTAYSESDTLDSVSDRGNSTDQTLSMGGIVINGAAGTATSIKFNENGTDLIGIRYSGNASGNPLDIHNFQTDTLLMRVLESGVTTFNNSLTASSFIKSGGTSSQFLKADGSVDSSTYLRAHPTVAASASSNNGGRTYIQDIFLDSFGHITGIGTATETVVDTNNFVTGHSWNSSTGVLTTTLNDGSTTNVNLVNTLSDVTVTGGTYTSGTQILTLTKNDGSTVDVSGFAIDTDVNWYTTGSTFNSSNGIITFTRSDGGTYTVDIDGKYSLLNHVHTFASLTSKPTTLSGYGITDGATSTQGSNADTAYGWGNHGSVGYLTSYNDEYTTGATFNTGDGVITFRRNDGDTFTVDIDGRFASSSHKYHSFSNGDEYYDGYGQNNFLRLFTENSVHDNFRFRSYSDVEYYNGSQWVSWNQNLDTLFDGLETTGFNLSHTHSKFRFVIQRSSGWPTTANFVIQSSWSDINTTTGSVTLETHDGSQYNLKDSWTYGSYQRGYNLHTTSQTHDGKSQMRVTIDLNWSDASHDYTALRRILMLSNFSGNQYDMKPFTWAYDQSVTFANVINVSGGNSTEWNTSYDYSQVGHLPLSGGTITGSLEVRQTEDDNGIKIFGYDDRSTYSGNIYIDSAGNFKINQTHGVGSGYIQIGAENYLSLDAASLVYTSSTFRIYDDGRLDFGSSGDYKIKYNATADNLVIHTNDNLGITLDSVGNTTFTGTVSASGYNDGNWNTAYGWGDHSTEGYIKSFTNTNEFVTGATFNSGDGVITFTRNNGGDTFTVDIDGRHVFKTGDTMTGTLIVPTLQIGNATFSRSGDQNHVHFVGTALIPNTSTTSSNSNMGTSTYRWKGVYGGLGDFSGIVTASGGNSGNWNTAYGWGNHAGLYSLLNHTHTFASLTSTPTTLSGYGITDAASSTHTHTFASLTSTPTTLSGYGITDAATSAQGTKADTAYGWGNHASAGYSLTSHNHDGNYLKLNPRLNANADTITTSGIHIWDVSNATDDPSGAGDGLLTTKYWDSTNWAVQSYHDFHSNNLYIRSKQNNVWQTSWSEVFTTDNFTDSSGNWNTAYGWGNHASVGYITGFTDTNEFVTGATFNSGTGVVTFTRNNGGDIFTLNLASTLTDVTVTGGTYTAGTQTLRLTKSNGSTVDVSGFAIDTDVNWYTTSATFNTGNGIITGSHQGGTWTVDIDGRYAYSSHNHDGTYMKTNRTLTSINTIDNGGDRYEPSVNNPTNEHYAVLTYGNGGNVTGQLATHFITGDLYSRGYNSTWSGWQKYWSTMDFSQSSIGNWNTAYEWGNHANTYSLLNHTHTFASLTSKPTTLSGYGITDAASSTHTHPYLPLAGGTMSGELLGYVSTSNTDGQNNLPFRLSQDYNSYMVATANNTWGLFWAGGLGAKYGTNGVGGPGDIWGNSANPNEFVFVGSDSTKWTLHGNSGNTWQLGTISASNFSGTHSGTSSGTNTGDQTNISGNAATATYATTAGSAPNASNLNSVYGVSAGDGRGLKFWNGSDNYKIGMGNADEYHYGPVTDYSIKMVMDSNNSTRGFTWGVNGGTPIAGLNVGNGNMQIAGTFTASGYNDGNWNTAYGWGNHSGLYSLTSHNHDDRYFQDNKGSISLTGSNPFDDSKTETQVTGSGSYVINYTGASAHLFSSNVGGSASMFQIGAHYNGSDFYMRTRTDSTSWNSWKQLWHSGDFSSTNISNWNTAYGWGNHANTYSLLNHTHTFASLTSKPTTVSGYGITDMGSQSVSSATTATNLGADYTADDWFRATGDNNPVKFYGGSTQMTFRTDGATEAYSGVGAYPFVWSYGGSSSTERIMLLATTGRIWSKVHGWLDEAFSTLNHTHTFASLTSKPTTLSGYGITDAASSTHTHTFASLTSKPTTLSGYGITDAASSANVSNWNTAYGWGNHASAGYIVKGSEIASSSAWTTATKFGSVGELSGAAGNHALSVRSELGNDAFMSFHIGSDYAIHFGLDGASNRLHVGGWSDGTGTQYQMYDSRDGSASNWNTAYGWGNHASGGYATQTYVGEQIGLLVDSAPGTLDTLNELAAALGDDPNFATTITTSIGNKLPLAGGTMSGDIIFNNNIRLEYSTTHWITPRDTSGNMHLHTATGGIYLDAPVIYFRERGSESNKITIDNGTLTATGTISASNFSGTHSGSSSGTNTGDQTNISGNATTATEAQNNYFYVRGTSPSIQFVDTDQGQSRYVHHNGGGIGFLTAGGSWSLRCGDGSAEFYGTVSATNLSGTNTGDQTNISGNAATATYATTAGSAPNGSNANQFYNVSSGDGNGLRLWDGQDGYKISMGNSSVYHYGPVTDYSIKTQMNGTAGRGFTWGTNGSVPIAGLNSVNGDMQIAGTFKSTGLTVEGTISGSTVFDVQGTQGQLFSITDDLTGDLFTVSDISGIPILSVNSLGVVTIDDTLRVTGDVIAYAASDSRLKENITPISNPLDKLKLIGGYEFDWNGLSKNNGHDVGVIAQEIELVLPELVGIRGDGYKGVQYDKLTALLIEAVKEQQKQIDELKSKLNK